MKSYLKCIRCTSLEGAKNPLVIIDVKVIGNCMGLSSMLSSSIFPNIFVRMLGCCLKVWIVGLGCADSS